MTKILLLQVITKINNIKRKLSTSLSCFRNENASIQFPLEGVRIIDLTRIIAGPYCSMVLADMGADVIKVERPITGDESRHWGPPFLENTNTSVYFTATHRNKKSICIDMKRGQDIIYELCKKSDVLLENYIPGKLDKMKLGYEDLKKVAPKLIYCSITGYGSHGPYKEKPGYDVIAASKGGLLHITGESNGPPVKVGVAVTDICTGLYAHGAIIAALYQREKTGKGQKIDVNLLSTQISMLINIGASFLNTGKESKRWGTAHETLVPYEAFKTKSGYITICCGSNEQFQSLCTLLNIAEVLKDHRFINNENRVSNRIPLIKILTEIFETQTNTYWIKHFETAKFPFAPINTMTEVFDDPHIKDIGIVKELQHPVYGKIKVVGPPVEFSMGKNNARTAPPLMGEHTNEILREILGYDNEYIDKLKIQKLVQ